MKFVLDKGNAELAAAEALALVKVDEFVLNENILEINKEIQGLDKRLALTKEIIIDNKKIIISKKDLMNRRAHLLPEGHPASTTPKLARAMVNLTGAQPGDTIVDPFCGAGGILIEAGLMGMHIAGYDIDEIMLRRAKINLDFFKIENYKLDKKDATTAEYKGFVVTDLPYGKGTKVSDDLNTLYFNFLKKIKSKKAVIGFPDFIDYKSLIKNAGLKLEQDFTWYLHKTLSKKITVVYKTT